MPYYKMALRNIRTYSHWTLKYVRDFCAYPPLHFLSTSIRKQRQLCCSPHICAVADRTCRDWFKRLREGDMLLEDRPRSQCFL